MTTKDQSIIGNLLDEIKSLKESNAQLNESLTKRVRDVENVLSKKNESIFLEKEIIQESRSAISTAIVGSFNRYDSPLSKLSNIVLDNHKDEIKEILESSIISMIKDNGFVDSLNEELSHKISRILIDSSKGICESITTDLKNDNVFRAKLTIAVSRLIEEYRQIKNK